MGIAYLQKGTVVSFNGRVSTIKREVSPNKWQLEDNHTGYLEVFSINDLLIALEQDKLQFMSESSSELKDRPSTKFLPDANDERFNHSKLKRLCVKAVMDLPASKAYYEAVLKELWMEKELTQSIPHWQTVRRWVLRFISGAHDIQSLLGDHHKKGNRSDRYPAEVIDVVNHLIDSVYLTKSRPTRTRILELATAVIQDKNSWLPESAKLPLPSTRLVKGLIEKIPAFDRDVARRGVTVARRMYRGQLNHIETNQRLEVAEIDHTRMDIMVLDENGLPRGRPWLTVCIDRHTRCVLGIYIGFVPPSYLSVSRCLKHALRPKLSLTTEYPSIKNSWDAFGVMKTLVVDNGMEFHSNSFEKACLKFDIEIKYSPRKAPWYKGVVERFMRSINEGICHGNPGTTFSNIFDKEDYDPEKHAVIRYDKFREIVFKWIADYYHQKPHTGLEGMKPAYAWANSESISCIPVPTNFEAIDILLGKYTECSLTHKGVQINNLLYNSLELIDWRKQAGEKLIVVVLVDEDNLGQVHIRHPIDEYYISVPALNQEYAQGLSLWQHKFYRKTAKQSLGKDDEKSWMSATRDIQKIVTGEHLFKRKSAHARARQGRLIESLKNTEVVIDQYQNAQKDFITEKASMDDIEEFSPIIQERQK